MYRSTILALLMIALFVVPALADDQGIEAKLDGMHSLMYTVRYQQPVLWFDVLYDLLEDNAFALSRLDRQIARLEAKLGQSSPGGAGLDTVLDAIEAKLDDETSFTDDIELGELQTALTNRIDSTDAKLDTVIGYIDTEIATIEGKLDSMQTELADDEGALKVEIDANETKIDAIIVTLSSITTALASLETKLDNLQTELAAVKDSIITQVNDNETLILGINTDIMNQVEANEALLGNLEAKLDTP